MRLLSYRHRGLVRAGVEDGEHVVPFRDLAGLGADLQDDSLSADRLDEDGRVLQADVELLPVVPMPGRIFCVGLNYYAHIDETGRDRPEYPVLFCKFASSLVAHGEPILLPHESNQVDYEAELAVVIGRGGRRISEADALEHVLGYTIANDVTMRDYQYKTHQWLQGKAWDRSTPLGPVLVTPDEVDVRDVDISLQLNGEVLQASSTRHLMFDVPALVSAISEFTALLPGDVILTGTPGGVGFRRNPQVFLADGDTVEVAIEGIGTLSNPVAAESR